MSGCGGVPAGGTAARVTGNRCLAGIPENDNAAMGRVVSELEAMVAPVLHLRLSVMVRRGKALTVTTDQLGEWIYGGPPASGREARRRREEVRHGLDELGRLPGWALCENRRRLMVSIARGAKGGSQDAVRPPAAADYQTAAAA